MPMTQEGRETQGDLFTGCAGIHLKSQLLGMLRQEVNELEASLSYIVTPLPFKKKTVLVNIDNWTGPRLT